MAFFIYKALYINENYCVPNPGQDNHDAVVLESIQDTYVVCHWSPLLQAHKKSQSCWVSVHVVQIFI